MMKQNRIKLAHLLILLLFASVSIHAQTDSEKKLQAGTLSNEALDLFDRGTPESFAAALPKFEQAGNLYLEIDNKSNAGKSFYYAALTSDKLENSNAAPEFYEKALSLFQISADNQWKAQTLNNLGLFYSVLSENQKALEYFGQALEIYKILQDKNGEANALNSIGAAYSELGENQKGADFYRKALTIYKSVKNKSGEATALNNLGAFHSTIGENQKALETYRQALEIYKIIQNKSGEAATLGNIGAVYDALGDAEKGLENYKQSLAISRALKDKAGEATTLNNIGAIYDLARDLRKAVEYYELSLPISREIGDKIGEATTLHNIGAAYDLLGEKQKALEFYKSSLPLSQQVGDKNGEAVTLNNIGAVYNSLGEKQKAFEFLNRALTLGKTVGDRNGEANTLTNLMYAWSSSKNPRFAVFYGKQAINKYQELRQAIVGLDNSLQKSFLSTFEKTYKKLAELLIAEGRIVEAEQVLNLLKQEEVFDYLKRDASEAEKLSKRADLTEQEAVSLKKYEEFGDKITALGAEFGDLQKLQIDGVELTAEQEKRYGELAVKLEDASRSFQVFLREIAGEFDRRANTEKDLQENLALQTDLKSWGEGVVFIYTLVGEDRFRTILITPDAQTDGKTEISAADLNKKISDFRQIVQNPNLDPRPLGKELYDILIKPIEKQLAGAKAKTILWSLDGNTRLLPLAALWDGNQYFGQKYQNVTITLASRTRLNDAVSGNWRVLGLGVSEAKTVKGENGTRDVIFDALPSVVSELDSIVKTENSDGVLPGQSLLNAEFTEKNLQNQLLKGYKVIHIASHFNLNAGDATKSFLLLGDGGILTVDEIKNSPLLKFGGVELLTLSACQTAVTGKDSTGKEIEGFGYVAQQKGAKAILATLWSVADSSTQLLMTDFYRLRKENPQMTKAEAMQTAQNEMIEGRLKPAKSSAESRSGVFIKDEKNLNAPKFDTDENKPFSHPYFWSPFVLIGNWK